MTEMTRIELEWRGKETIDAVRAYLGPSTQIDISLPANYNHALFAHLMPDAPKGQMESLDVEGDESLLAEVAKVKGLEDFATLIETLSGKSAQIKVQTPPRIVISIT